MVDPRLRVIEQSAGALAARAIAAARALTRDGHAIDDHQVVVERVAHAATEARVIAELAALPDELGEVAVGAAAELAAAMPHRLAPVAAALDLGPLDCDAEAQEAIAAGLPPAGGGGDGEGGQPR